MPRIAIALDIAGIFWRRMPRLYLRAGGRYLVLLALALLAVAYDVSVAEFSGDLRWLLLHGLACLLAAGGLFAVRGFSPRSLRRVPAAVWLSLLLLAWSAVSLAWTMNPHLTGRQLRHQSAYMILFLFVYILRDARWYGRMLWIIVAGMGINCIIGLTQYYGITDADVMALFPPWRFFTAGFTAILRGAYTLDGTGRALGGNLGFLDGDRLLDFYQQVRPPAATLANRNLLGSYLVLVLPAAVCLALTGCGLRRRLPALMLFGFGLLMLFYTRSRASWLGAVCAMLYLVACLVLNRRQRGQIPALMPKSAWAVMALLMLAAVFMGNLRGRVDVGRAGMLDRLRALGTGQGDDPVSMSVNIRLAYNANALAMIRDRPWTGVGLGAFYTAYPAYHQAVRATPERGFSPHVRPRRLHNDLGQAAVELGLPGLVVYVAWFVCLLWMSHCVYADPRSGPDGLTALCLMSGVLGLAVNALADFPMQMPMSAALVWCYAGMLTGLYAARHDGAGPDGGWIAPRWMGALCGVAVLLAGCLVVRDGWAHRRGAQYLQGVIARSNAGMFDERTLRLLRRSMDHYDRDARLQEYRALVYANYSGTDIVVDVDTRINEVTAALQFDPYSPHKLINLAGLYIMQARHSLARQDYDAALDCARSTERILMQMQAYPGFFADQTHALGGFAQLLLGALREDERAVRWPAARALLEKALQLNPEHAVARDALRRMDELSVAGPRPEDAD